MKKILLIATGGTIAMKVDEEKGGAVPSVNGDELIKYLPPIENLSKIDIYEFSNIPSPYMNLELWIKLAKLIDEKADLYDGFVITHGTDTLEETAFFLELTLKTKKPVALTAAMRNIDDISGDGPRNMWGALKTVVSDEYDERIGVTLVLNDEVHDTRDVTKTYTSNVATFKSPLFGPIGLVDKDKVVFYYRAFKRIKIFTDKIEKNVALIKAYAGMNADIIDAVVDLGYKGIVIEAFGRGNLPEWVVPSVKRAIEKGVVVVISSRCYMGRVLGDYAYVGGGKNLEEAGAIFSYDLRGIKARILLMLLLGKYENDTDKIKEMFGKI